jgi:hypothetical protein
MAIKTLLAALLVPTGAFAAVLPQLKQNNTIRIISGDDAQKDDFPCR